MLVLGEGCDVKTHFPTTQEGPKRQQALFKNGLFRGWFWGVSGGPKTTHFGKERNSSSEKRIELERPLPRRDKV